MRRRDQSTRRARVGVLGGSEPRGAACHEGPSWTWAHVHWESQAASVGFPVLLQEACSLMQEDNRKSPGWPVGRPCF